MAKEDFVDLTPTGDGGEREVRLTTEDLEIIKDNKDGLTKEGCMVRVWHWSQAANFQMLIRYLAMYKMCKQFAKSGQLENDAVILARRKHTSKQGITKEWLWKEKIGKTNELGEVIIMESVDKLKEFVEGKLHNLKFITTKGG